jgi:hypothetical protein
MHGAVRRHREEGVTPSSPCGAPSDDLCVAGELLAAEPTGPTWSLRGRIVELVPAQSASSSTIMLPATSSTAAVRPSEPRQSEVRHPSRA